jgi:SAM-dependent methyltransferase
MVATSLIDQFQCVKCGASLELDGKSGMKCISCKAQYPIVNEIPILTSFPTSLLGSHCRALQRELAELDRKRNYLGASENVHNEPGRRLRAQRMLNGSHLNVKLIERYMQPLVEHVSNNPEQLLGLDQVLSLNEGMSPQEALRYFYQDWAPTNDFKFVEGLIIGALKEYSPWLDALAVLGCGACGIARAASEHCRIAFGVDLSVPTLLIAQGILLGDPIEIFLKDAEWRPVRLSCPGRTKNNLSLVSADVKQLPFPNASLSAVVTQYLMGAVGNPLRVVEEIKRVLEPGGSWVNFSRPFKVPGESPELGAPALEELPSLLGPMGWQIVKMERQRFNFLNLEQIYQGGDRISDEVDFVVAMNSRPSLEVSARRGNQVPDNDAVWWKRIPKLVPGMEVTTIRKREFEVAGPKNCFEITLRTHNRALQVTQDHVALIELLFEQIDGIRSIGEVFDGLKSRGIRIRRSEFSQLISFIVDQYGVLSLKDQNLYDASA